MNRRIAHAKKLIDAGQAPSTVRDGLRRKFKLSPAATANVMDKVHTLMAEEYEQLRPQFKMLQVHRIHKHIEVARSEHRVDVAIRGESELSKVIGSRAPTKIEINPDSAYRDAIVKTLAGFSKDDLARLVEEQLELERRAGSVSHG